MNKEEIKKLIREKKLSIHNVFSAFCEEKKINTKKKFDLFLDDFQDYLDDYRDSLI